MNSQHATIAVKQVGPVLHLIINRPHVMNAMDSHAHLALSEALDYAAAADDIRVVVLTGAGEKAFSAGRDLKELADRERMPPAQASLLDARWGKIRRLTDRFDFDKPIIARVNGVALGGGFELALACDIIIAAEHARFALPEARRGLIPFAGGVHRLPRQIPLKQAMGYMLTGRPMSASRALELGLLNEVVAMGRLDECVSSWVEDILACAPLSVRAIKQCAMQGIGMPLEAAMKAVYPAEERRRLGRDAKEGPQAFAEGRAPVWTGK